MTHTALTPREIDVLLQLMDGSATAAIAAYLVVSLDTVRFHLRNIREKTGQRTLHAVVAWGFRHETCCCTSPA